MLGETMLLRDVINVTNLTYVNNLTDVTYVTNVSTVTSCRDLCDGFLAITVQCCDRMDKIRWVFEIVLPIIILILGLVANSIITIVFMRRRLKGSHYCLVIIAVTDMVWLVVNYLHHYVRKWGSSWAINLTYCKITGVLSYASTGCSYWLTTAMVIIRLCSITRPIRTKQFTTVRNIRRLTLAIITVTLTVHVPFFVTEKMDTDKICYDQDSVFSTFMSSVHFSVFVVVPFVMLIVTNTILCYKLNKRPRRDFPGDEDDVTSLRQVSGRMSRLHHRRRLGSSQLTLMLMISSWLYAVLNLPWYVQDIYYGVYYLVDKSDRYRAAVNSITWTIGMLNYADNGLVFFLMFKPFRERVYRTFSCRSY